MNDAGEVAVGIFQDDKIISRFISPWIAGCSHLDQPLHLTLTVVCIEVEVQSTPFACALFWNLVQSQVGPSALRITKNHPAALGRLLWGRSGARAPRMPTFSRTHNSGRQSNRSSFFSTPSFKLIHYGFARHRLSARYRLDGALDSVSMACSAFAAPDRKQISENGLTPVTWPFTAATMARYALQQRWGKKNLSP